MQAPGVSNEEIAGQRPKLWKKSHRWEIGRKIRTSPLPMYAEPDKGVC